MYNEGEGYGRKRLWTSLRCYPEVFLERLKPPENWITLIDELAEIEIHQYS
jgi:hypothetical protein